MDFVTLDSATTREQLALRSSCKLDERTGEVYLPLSGAHAQYRLTPARLSDADAVIEMMNDPAVYPNLFGPAYPFARSNFDNWLKFYQGNSTKVFQEWEEGKWNGLTQNPFTAIREADSGNFVGEIYLGAGAQAGIWELGACLVPAYHGKGITPAAIRTLLDEYLIPHTSFKELIAQSFTSNMGSARAFEKAGFVKDEKRSGGDVQQPESKGGRKETEVVMVWTRSRV